MENSTLYLLAKIICCLSLIIIFYKNIKQYAFDHSGKIAVFFKLNRFYPYETSKGVIELSFIVILHFLFCIFLIKFLGIKLSQLGINLKEPLLLFEGVLLGIGIMGTSALIGRLSIEFLRYIYKNKYSYGIKDWLAMARSGWIRHYFHTLEVLPLPLALLVTLGQVCGEEIVFRGVLINYFLPYGKYIALFISTTLFMYMQTFHMPNRLSGVFPMIGALVVGLASGTLYIYTHTLLPLIIAHFTFFAVAVL